MAALVESHKKTSVLMGDIQQHAVKKALEEDRRQDIVHPSEMAKEDWCPRQTAYRIQSIRTGTPVATETAEVHGYRMLTIFQEGHDIHSKWQTWLGQMGRIWGKWKCPVCDHTVWQTGVPTCPTHDVSMDYREVPLDAEEEWMISGHSDGAVPDVKSMIEIKSIGLGTVRMEEPQLVREHTVKTVDGKSIVDYDALWKGIKRPLKSHRKQGLVYLAIARLRGYDLDQMVYLYENKANQDTKEFVIKYSDEAVAPLIDQAKDIKWAVENNQTLPRPVGNTKDAPPCKGCPFKTHCWEETTNDDSNPEPHAEDGRRVPRSQAKTRPSAHPHADQAERRLPRTARRPDRTDRQRADAPVRADDEVGGVPEHATGRSRGRREVRRRVSGAGQGGQGPQ